MTREEAIKTVRNIYQTDKEKEALAVLIPELRESDDERIRRELIEFIKWSVDRHFMREDFHQAKRPSEWIAYLEKQKEQDKCPEYCVRSHCIGCSIYEKQKPILEVFGFKVGDAVRLKDGDGRKHIIKSFEEVEGVHGPNFYHVEFEDNSARDGIYPGEEYPNGYYTQMEKFKEEQKPSIFPPGLGEVHWNPIPSGKDIHKWNLPEDFEEAVYKVANFISPFDSQDELRRVSHRFAEQLMSLAKKELMGKPVEWNKATINGEPIPTENHSVNIPLAEWSGEDNICWDEAFACVTRAKKTAKNEEELQSAVTAEKWLKEIQFKYYVHPVKQEWSEEDEKMLKSITGDLFCGTDFNMELKFAASKKVNWLKDKLKSIRPNKQD